jgi:hypothetical protein
MTQFQNNLIEKLLDKEAPKQCRFEFNGEFLNCSVTVTSKGKKKPQKFSFVFDSAEDCQGARQVGRMTGAYSETYAARAFEVIVAHADEIAKLEV